MKFEIIDTLTKFNELESEWRKLFFNSDHNENIFASFDWHKAVLQSYQPLYKDGKYKLAIVVGRRSDKVELICPLVLVKSFGARILNWIGNPVSQYGDMIVRPGKAGADIIDEALKFVALETKADALVLERVQEMSAVVATLKRNSAMPLRQRKAPLLNLEDVKSADRYFAGLSAARRKKHRRLWRRLCERGPAKFEILNPGPDALAWTRRALQLKKQNLIEQGTYSRAFSNSYFEPFFHALAEGKDANVGYQAGILTCNDKLIAAELGFRCNGAYIAHIGVYDPAYKKYAPGHLLMERMLRHSIEKGVKRYDFLAPQDEFKSAWQNESAKVIDFGLPLTKAGQLYCTILKMAHPTADMLKRTLPSSLMRVAANK